MKVITMRHIPVSNDTSANVRLRLEPEGDSFTLGAGDKCELRYPLRSEDDLEVVIESDSIAFHCTEFKEVWQGGIQVRPGWPPGSSPVESNRPPPLSRSALWGLRIASVAMGAVVAVIPTKVMEPAPGDRPSIIDRGAVRINEEYWREQRDRSRRANYMGLFVCIAGLGLVKKLENSRKQQPE